MEIEKITLTIGIPAYNEEANIGYLLSQIAKQKNTFYKLQSVIIASDGSDDDTIKISKRVKNLPIKIFDNKDRMGPAYRQGQIIEATLSDVIVLLNADIYLEGKDFINELVRPLIFQNADITSSSLNVLPAKTFFEKILNASYKLKNSVYESYKNGDNIYTCHGAARAFSKKLYKKIIFKESVGEDAYSYLYAKYHHYTYIYVKNAKAFIKSPVNFKDHKNQSVRFVQSKEKFVKEFGREFVTKEYSLPFSNFFLPTLKSLINQHIYIILFAIIFVVIRAFSPFIPKASNTWNISRSSKILR